MLACWHVGMLATPVVNHLGVVHHSIQQLDQNMLASLVFKGGRVGARVKNSAQSRAQSEFD